MAVDAFEHTNTWFGTKQIEYMENIFHFTAGDKFVLFSFFTVFYFYSFSHGPILI